MRFKLFFAVTSLLVLSLSAAAQQGPADSTKAKTAEQKIDATPIKSALSYQTLSQFFQTSVTTGANGGFDFKSSWWAVKKLFNGDAYEKYYSTATGRFDRNFEIALGVHKTSGGSYSMLTGGIKYSPINNRGKSDVNFLYDKTFQRALLDRHDVMNEANKLYRQKYVNALTGAAQIDAEKKIDSLEKKFTTSHKYSDLPKEFNDIRENLIRTEFHTEAYDAFSNAPDSLYNIVAKKVDMGSLLTINVNPGYDYNHQNIDSTGFTITYLKGFGKNQDKPFNLEITGSGLLFRDTLLKAHNTARHELTGKIGINKILVNDSKKNPLIEFALQYEDTNHLNTPLYKGEEKNQMTGNAVLTVHLSSTLSLPITLKYDLKKPNLFGIFNLSWNFENSKSNTTN